MEPHPVYAGADFNAAPSPKASTPSVISPIQHASTSGYNKAMHALSEVEEDTYNRMEYTLDQERKIFMAETLSDIEADSIRRLSLPNGAADSFYDERGKFRDSFFKDYLSSQKARFNGLEQGYIKPESITSAKEDIIKIKQKIAANLSTKIAANLSTRAKDATLKLADYQADLGQYDAAIATISGAPDDAFSPYEKNSKTLEYRRGKIIASAQSAVNNNDADAYYRLRYSGDMDDLTPQQVKQVQNLERNFLDTDGPVDLSEWDAPGLFPVEDATGETEGDELDVSGQVSPSSRSKSKKASQIIGLPLGVSDELVNLFDNWGGNFKDGEAQRQAAAALDNFASRFITPDMSPQDKELLDNIASHFNLDKSYPANLIRKYSSLFGSRKNFDYQASLKAINANFFVTQSLHKQLASARHQVARLASIDPQSLSKSALDAHKKASSDASLHLSVLQKEANDKKEEIIASVNKHYADWLTSLKPEELDSLTENQQKMKLYDIVDATMDSLNKSDYTTSTKWDFSSSPDYSVASKSKDDEDAARTQAINARKKLNAHTAQVDEARTRAAQEEETAVEARAEITPGRMSLSFAPEEALFLEHTGQEAFIAVPPDSPLVDTLLTVKHGNRTRRIPCYGYEGVSSPTLSMRARTNFGMNENSRFHLIYDAKGNARFISDHVPQKDVSIYQTILNNEIGNRDISVHELPTADGGGEWEVAGINIASHPAQATKLRNMIKAGASQEQLKESVFAYYKEYTQSVADAVNPITNSKGIELFLRDCAFNHGPAGALDRVLRRAINAPSDADMSKALQTYMASHSNTELLKALSTARANYYAGIAANNPVKQTFLKGWLSRNRTTTAQALSLINAPSN